ncbi:hypothetical protein LSH36_133g05041 [Paralvinella palmiformis]|uniref:Uncharacterized protein n=1 Tax=Paralvinella palmiformis TaxID=53620 RepID=A0AAD9NAV4_9ANNE|nr:hypothetical protein LSH36_133g05041 [Paralvinella palmiformis]
MEKGKKKSKTFIPNLERPIPRRPLANRKTIIRSITFVRNWDSDVSAGGLSFNSDNLHDKSTDHGSDSDQQSISRMIASSPVPVVIASASDVYHRLPAHSEVGEAGVEDEASHGQKKNDSEDVVRSNSSIASGSSRSRKLLNGSVRTDTSPQKITKEGAPGQEDTDKECTSVRSSRHKSGRSNNNIASASTRSRKRLNWTMEMNTAPQVNVLSNTSVRSASTKSRKVSNRNDPKDTAPQAKNTSSSIQTMAMSSSADPGSGVSVHGINQTVHSRRTRKRQLSTSSAESRQQAESRPVQKAINYFAKTVQTDLREMIAKFARAKIITSSLASSERKLNKKRKELLSVHQTLAEIKHDVAKLKYIMKKGKS